MHRSIAMGVAAAAALIVAGGIGPADASTGTVAHNGAKVHRIGKDFVKDHATGTVARIGKDHIGKDRLLRIGKDHIGKDTLAKSVGTSQPNKVH